MILNTVLTIINIILCKNFGETDEKFIDNIRNLESEIGTILNENRNLDAGFINGTEETFISGDPNYINSRFSSDLNPFSYDISGFNRGIMDEIGKKAIIEDFDYSQELPKDVVISEKYEIKSPDSDILVTPDLIDDKLYGNTELYGDTYGGDTVLVKEKTLTPTISGDYLVRDSPGSISYQIPKNTDNFAANNLNSGLKIVSVHENPYLEDPTDLTKKLITSVNDLDKVYSDVPKKEKKPGKTKFTFSKHDKYQPLSKSNKRAIVKTLIPDENKNKVTYTHDSRQPETIVVEKKDIDKDETIKKLILENDALKNRLKINSKKEMIFKKSLEDNIIKKELLKEGLHNGLNKGLYNGLNKGFRYPIIHKPSILNHPRVNKRINIVKKSLIDESIDNKINDAHNDIEKARLLHNRAARHKKAANRLKTSAEVENMVAKELGPNYLGVRINDKSLIDNMRANVLNEEAEKEKIKSDVLLGNAIGKINTAGDTAIAENFDIIDF
ncbi:hypothetical protein DMUE_2478 [Dictyocoela muelleri]|nr:hypothetical protein DMUE_2478 [Dictyocoela muelleri]